MQTHETYIAAIVGLAMGRLDDAERKLVDDAKIVYGMGTAGLRGVTYYGAWTNGDGPDCPHSFVEICAAGESSAVQLAGTTLHEVSHVIAGYGAGHGRDWKDTCKRVGLRIAHAAGQQYSMAYFDPETRDAIARMESPFDGEPVGREVRGLSPVNPKPCGAAVGVRGGKSRGKGSGSRSLKVSCGSCGYVARVSRTWLDKAGAPLCPCNSEPMTEG